jgi:hypothetical protein
VSLAPGTLSKDSVSVIAQCFHKSNPIPANRGPTNAEITDNILEEGRRHVDIIVSTAGAAIHNGGNLSLMKRISENNLTMIHCSYRLAGISVYCDLMAANGVIVGIRGSTWVTVEKSCADRNDRLTFVLG